MAELMVALDEDQEMIPNLKLAQMWYEYEVKSSSSSSSSSVAADIVKLKTDIISTIEKANMADIYTDSCEKLGLVAEDNKLNTMK